MPHFYEHVSIPMRDDIALAAILFRPSTGAAPTLVVRTPYGHGLPIAGNQGTYPHLISLLDAGYAVLWVECRGTFKSQGDFRPKVQEVDDGYDTLDWIVTQPWSNGNVGAYGMSYFGMTQWAMAISGHPALKAVAPVMTALDWYKGVWYHPGGALSHAVTTPWFIAERLNSLVRSGEDGDDTRATIGELRTAIMNGNRVLDCTPLAEHPLLPSNQNNRSTYHEILEHPSYDDYWEEQDYTRDIENIRAPALIITGWYDIFIAQTLNDFTLIRSRASTPAVREESRLIVGPWDHADLDMSGIYPARDFGVGGSGGAVNLTGEHIDHFARHIPTDSRTGDNDLSARVKLFVMGIDEWRTETDWPPTNTGQVDYYLNNSSLSQTIPSAPREYAYSYDPQDPVRTTTSDRTSTVWQPNDQREKSCRADVLTFIGTKLDAPLEVIGHVSAKLWVSSDALDTDFTAMLIDVFPDGRAVNLCHGILRMRYRGGLSTPDLLVPGTVYEVEIDMAVTANVFLPGHRVRVDISSSNFPRFDRNTNTGGNISQEAIHDSVVAHNVLHTGPNHPSRITLPISTVQR